MIRHPLFVLLVGVGLVAGCSSKEPAKTSDVSPSAASVDRSYTAQASKDIDRLEHRIDNLRESKNFKKFGSSRSGLRGTLNQAYADLGEARRELGALRASADDNYGSAKALLENQIEKVDNELDKVSNVARK